MPEDRRLSLDEKTSKISMTSWVNAIRDYMEEHGLDTVFRIFDSEADSEVYILQDWGKADPSIVTAWESTLETGVGKCSACDYDFDNLKWSGKAIMNSIALDLWETIEKDVGTGANGPRTFAAIIAKIQQVSSSSVRTMVDNLKKLRSINEPGQDVDSFGSKVIELARRIDGSGLPPLDLSSIVAGCFLECDVKLFQLTALTLHNQVDDDPCPVLQPNRPST